MERISIMQYLDERGFKHAQRGFGYLVDAIQMASEKPDILNAVTKELYPSVAKNRGATASRVERAIRHSIETAEGVRVRITNSELIARAADDLVNSTGSESAEIPRCCLCGKLDRVPFELEGHPICRDCGTKIKALLEDRERNKRLFVAEAEAENG